MKHLVNNLCPDSMPSQGEPNNLAEHHGGPFNSWTGSTTASPSLVLTVSASPARKWKRFKGLEVDI